MSEMHVSVQNKDGTWSAAKPLKMPWYVRLELWIRKVIRSLRSEKGTK